MVAVNECKHCLQIINNHSNNGTMKSSFLYYIAGTWTYREKNEKNRRCRFK